MDARLFWAFCYMDLIGNGYVNQGSNKVRPKVSLLSLLLIIALIAVGIAFWQNSRRLGALGPEVRRLRDEVGQLSIDDRTKFHAISVDTHEPNSWRWRLFLPKGARYGWHIACEGIPRFSPPTNSGTSSFSNEPYHDSENEVLVDAQLREDGNGDWILSVASHIGDSKHQMSGASLRIPSEKIDWMSSVSSTDGQVLGSKGTAVKDSAGPIILLQRRACEMQDDGEYRPSDNPMPGFMIWLSKW